MSCFGLSCNIFTDYSDDDDDFIRIQKEYFEDNQLLFPSFLNSLSDEDNDPLLLND